MSRRHSPALFDASWGLNNGGTSSVGEGVSQLGKHEAGARASTARANSAVLMASNGWDVVLFLQQPRPVPELTDIDSNSLEAEASSSNLHLERKVKALDFDTGGADSDGFPIDLSVGDAHFVIGTTSSRTRCW